MPGFFFLSRKKLKLIGAIAYDHLFSHPRSNAIKLGFTSCYEVPILSKFKANQVELYFPSVFNYNCVLDPYFTRGEFTSWYRKQAIFEENALQFGQSFKLPVIANQANQPDEPERLFLFHKHLFLMSVLNDEIFELTKSQYPDSMVCDYIVNVLAIMTNERLISDMSKYSDSFPEETQKINQQLDALKSLMSDFRTSLPRRVFRMFVQVNDQTFTCLYNETALRRSLQRQSAGQNRKPQFCSREEYSTTKAFSSLFWTYIVALMREENLEPGYFELSNAFLRLASIVASFDSYIWTWPDKWDHFDPFNPVQKFFATGLNVNESLQKLVNIRNECLRSLEYNCRFFQGDKLTTAVKCYQLLAGLTNFYSTTDRFGWKLDPNEKKVEMRM